MTGVVVVAHPDDESLWFAGLMLRRTDVRWTVICCTLPRIDPVRAEKFEAACAVLGAEPVRLDIPELGPGRDIDLGTLSDLSGYDLVVTHGAAGEYGHHQHKQVHGWVTARYPHAITTGGKELVLTEAEWAQKLEAICCYDHVTRNGQPKWRRLLAVYGGRDLRRESYVGA